MTGNGLDGMLVAVELGLDGEDVEVLRTDDLFEIASNVYDTVDGERFLFAVPVESDDPAFRLIVNWPALLEGSER